MRRKFYTSKKFVKLGFDKVGVLLFDISPSVKYRQNKMGSKGECPLRGLRGSAPYLFNKIKFILKVDLAQKK